MKRHVDWLTVLVALGLMCAAGQCAAQEGKLAPEKRAQIEDAVSRFMARSGAPGVSAAAVVNGEHVWSEGFGMADLENNVPVTPQTLFRLGSVSKPITATAAMHLWEQGRLDLDAPVQKYCPAFPKKEWPISTRQLLEHLAGIRHYKSEAEGDQEINNTKHFDDPVAGGLQFFANDPLVEKPGTKFHYSTQGFTLVGCAIEGASAEKYVEYTREVVFEPAHMEHSQWDDRFAVIPHRTRFYSKSKSGTTQNAEFLDASYKIPGGGWLSSADDLANYEVALLADRLLKRATRDAMWTPQDAHESYALGWGTGKSIGVPDVGHNGGQQGTSTAILLAPEQRMGVVVLANMDGVDASALAVDVMKLLVGATTQGK
jgi:serine beta-lactamase-like protein LACTB